MKQWQRKLVEDRNRTMTQQQVQERRQWVLDCISASNCGMHTHHILNLMASSPLDRLYIRHDMDVLEHDGLLVSWSTYNRRLGRKWEAASKAASN